MSSFENIALRSERHFKYWLISPAIFLLLLIGLFPLVYSLIVSFQNINLIDVDTSFQGWLNYRLLFEDKRLWESFLHTMIFLVIALPIELILGMLLALLCLERLPGKQIFVALLIHGGFYSTIASDRSIRFSVGLQANRLRYCGQLIPVSSTRQFLLPKSGSGLPLCSCCYWLH